MAGEIVYAELHLPSSFPGSRAPLSAQPFSAQSPRWHRTALWVGWIGNLVLVITVIALGIWVSHLVSEKGQIPAAPGSDEAGSRDTVTAPGSDGAGNRDTATPPGSRDPSTAACSTHLERVRSQLCLLAQPGPAGGAGCKLCPSDWQLRGDKCYWVSTEDKTWNESRSDCAARGSQLLVFQDREELEALKDLTQVRAQFWVGLSLHSPGKAWTWLDQTRLLVPGPAKENSCGTVKGNQIQLQSCSAALPWICQQDAVPL